MPAENVRLLTCDVCDSQFEAGNTDEEAKREYEERSGRPWRQEDVAQVCSKCYYAMFAFSSTISTRRQ